MSAITTRPDVDWREVVERFRGAKTLVHLLPGLLTFKGQPYSLRDHFVFEPLFAAESPTDTVIRASRQVGKSSALAALSVLSCALRPHYKALHITPLYDQILKFSNDYAREFIEDSPVRTLLRSDKRSGSVLRRAFENRSIIYFSYAFESAERIRGISLAPFGRVNLDEVQSMNPDHFPVIGETMSACKQPCTIYSGTSLASAGPLEALWKSSSQASWVTRCGACNHDNIASLEYDLLKMIGPYRDDISQERPATICAKCGRPVFPRTGRWVHRRPESRMTCAGYHIPQIILPMHHEYPGKWQILLSKQAGRKGYTTSRFLNEVLGEASADGIGLVSETDLKRAAVLHRNDEETAKAWSLGNRYTHRVLGIDWGGGGEKGNSLTAVAVMGVRPDGVIDVIFGKKMFDMHDTEAKECKRLFNAFRCDVIAHDFSGAGNLRETVMYHHGIPSDRLMPIQYAGPAMGSILKHCPPNKQNTRHRWTANKTRTLQMTCYALRYGKIRTFAYDYQNSEEPGLLVDFLSLLENKVPRPGVHDAYTIIRSPHLPDDFAQAVNYGALALWHLTGSWPDFAGEVGYSGSDVVILED